MSKDVLILKKEDIYGDEDVDEVEEFSFNGYQVVRREFYAHTFDAAISFKYDSFTFNTACINKLDTMYVHLLVNPTEKKMVIRGCDEDAKDAVRWCRFNKKLNKRMPRKILCRLFAAKVYDLLNWFGDYKYKLQGNIVKTPEEKLIVFDLTETEVYSPVDKDGVSKGQVFFPEDWKNSFGMSVEQHHQSLVLNLLDGYERLEDQQKRQSHGRRITNDSIKAKDGTK
jgi:hypothetical protein